MGEFSIQLSADLVNRLVDGDEKSAKKSKRTKAKIPREPAHPQTKATEKQLHDDHETHKTAPSPGWPMQTPLYLPVTQPSQSENSELESIRSVVQKSEMVLEKLQKKEDAMVQEVTARAKDLRNKEFKLPYQKPMPCLADYEACRACYKEQSNDILKCAPLIRSYDDCVRRAKKVASSADK